MDETVIEIHRDGQWLPAATLAPLADERARVDYLPDYIFSDQPWPVSLTLPAGFAPVVARLPERMIARGVDTTVVEACRHAIDRQVRQLEAL